MIPNKIYKIANEMHYDTSQENQINKILIAYLYYVHIIVNFNSSPYKSYSIGQIANIKESKLFKFDESLITDDIKKSAIKILEYNGLLINKIDFDIILKDYNNNQKVYAENNTFITDNNNIINNQNEIISNDTDLFRKRQDELKINSLQEELYKNVRIIKNILMYFFILSLIGIISYLIVILASI